MEHATGNNTRIAKEEQPPPTPLPSCLSARPGPPAAPALTRPPYPSTDVHLAPSMRRPRPRRPNPTAPADAPRAAPRRRRAALVVGARGALGTQDGAPLRLESALGSRRLADVAQGTQPVRRAAATDAAVAVPSCSSAGARAGARRRDDLGLDRAAVDAKSVEALLDLATDRDEVARVDHDVHRGDNLGLGERPHVQVCA